MLDIDFTAACNPNPRCTLCTKDKINNIFCVPRAPGYPPRCILDEMTYEQVYEVLQRVPGAKRDLIKITDDPILLKLAETTRLRTPPQDAADRLQKKMNANSLPFYTVMRGNFDGHVK